MIHIGKRIEIIFNEYGQLVGRNSNRLSFFIGCLVRQMVPLTLDGWHRMESDLRERIWTCVNVASYFCGKYYLSHQIYLLMLFFPLNAATI